MKKNILFIIGTLFLCEVSIAQQITTTSTITPEQLIKDVLVSGCVETSNITSTVNGNASGENSYARFDKGSSSFPFESGIVISTGNADSAGNTSNSGTLNDGTTGWGTDVDLETALGISNTLNATTLEFDFVSVTNSLSFNYIFASEEYEGVFPCNANSDSFVFLIRETGTTQPYRNIAVVPGTNSPVNISNIRPEVNGFCTAENEQFFQGYQIGDTNFNGRTTVLTAATTIVPNQSYHIKLIIADRTDQFYDSAVFIEGSSFTTLFDLGPDISTCAPNVTLSADVGNPTATYSWFLDGTEIVGETTNSLVATQTGSYTIRATIPVGATSCIVEDVLEAVIEPEQTIGVITDFVLCDLTNTGDGIEAFDLTLKNTEVISRLPSSSYTIQYFHSENEARNNSNSITSPFLNSISPQEIFCRVEDNNSGCLGYGSFNLVVSSSLMFTEPVDFEVCASQNNPNSGTIDYGLLSSRIANGNLALNVSYYANEFNATNDVNRYNSNHQIAAPFETVYIRVEDVNSGCTEITSVLITVNSNPAIVYGDYFLDACESDNDGLAIFDLTTYEPIILGGIPNVSVSYHFSQAEAESGSNSISNTIAFQNTVLNLQYVFVRVANDLTGCYSTEVLELHTDVLLTRTNIIDIDTCDGILEDEIEPFDLNAIEEVFVNGLVDVSVRFFETESDRDNELNALDPTILYQNTTNPHTIYIVLESLTCKEVAEFDLIVNPSFKLLPVDPVVVCDEDDDERTVVDLEQFDSYVANGVAFQEVSYHLTLLDADANVNAISKNYANLSDPLRVFSRVTNMDGCIALNELEVDILPAPTVMVPSNIIICDDDQDGFFNTDLELKIPEITNETVDISVDFYTNRLSAERGINAIPNPTNFAITTGTIYARVNNTATTCFQIVSFQGIVNTLPVFSSPITPFIDCVLNQVGEGNFVLVAKDNEILQSQSGKRVSYYLTDADAHARINEISKFDNFQNTTNPQAIFARVENISDISCYAVAASFDLVVKEAPIYVFPTVAAFCDYDGSIDGGGEVNLDVLVGDKIRLSSTQILNITYHESRQDASLNRNSLPIVFTNSINPQEIHVRIETSVECYNLEVFTLNILLPPQLGVLPIYSVCDDDYDGIVVLDLTEMPVPILDARQSNYETTYFKAQSDLEADLNPIPNPETYQNFSNPETIFVKVTNTTTGCFSHIPVELQINLPPVFTDVVSHEYCETTDAEIDLSEVGTMFNIDSNAVAIEYYTSLTNAENQINGTIGLYTYSAIQETIYARLFVRATGCDYIDSFELVINPNPTIATPKDIEACDYDGNGTAPFVLTDSNAEILNGTDANRFVITYHNSEIDANQGVNILDTNYRAAHEEIIWFRVTDTDTTKTTSCFTIGNLGVVINPLPESTIQEKTTQCLNGDPNLITANLNPTDSYLWSTGETSQTIGLLDVGTYNVMITSDKGCEIFVEFEITPAEFLRVDVKHFKHPNSVTVVVSGDGVYEYQLDSESLQDANEFYDVSPEKHELTIYEVNGCLPFVKDFYVLNYPLYFFPHRLGGYGRWHLQGLGNITEVSVSLVRIYDRYGRLLKTLTDQSLGWDGKAANGKEMPASDYWFSADVSIDGKHIVLRGHFSLLR